MTAGYGTIEYVREMAAALRDSGHAHAAALLDQAAAAADDQGDPPPPPPAG